MAEKGVNNTGGNTQVVFAETLKSSLFLCGGVRK